MTPSRVDAFLVAAFALAITLPGLLMTWSAGELPYENRRAAEWPADWRKTSWRDTAARFEAAFADRLGGRAAALTLHHATLVRVFGVSPNRSVVFGEEGHLYYSGDARIAGASLASAVRARDAAQVLEGIVRRADYLRAKGIRYVVLVSPDKSTIYGDRLPQRLRSTNPSVLDLVVAGLPYGIRSSFLDVRPALRAARTGTEVYYRTDSHWNQAGAAIAFDALVDALHADRARVRPFPVTGARQYAGNGGLATMTGVPDVFAEPYFHSARDIEAIPDCEFRIVRRDAIDRIGEAHASCPDASLGRALVYRDSFFAPLVGPVAALFRESRFFWTNAWDPGLIDSFKPDVVVEEVVERDLAGLGQTYFLPGGR